MRSTLLIDAADELAAGLIQLLHQGAQAEDFAQRLAKVERLPEGWPGRPAHVEAVRMSMAVPHHLELHLQREAGMLAVIESAQELSSRLGLASLLAAIVSRARNLLGSEFAWLSVHDAERDEPQVRVSDGALVASTTRMLAQSDRGVASVVTSNRLRLMTPDYLHETRFPHDGSLDDTFRAEGIAALFGVPLVWDGEVIGLLFVAYRYHRVHTAQSVAILCTLATHAAVALRNAREFERANTALERAGQARAGVERHLGAIQAAADAHQQMTTLLARGASLAALCQSVTGVLGDSLLVLDEAGQFVGRGSARGYEGTGASGYAPHGFAGVEIAPALRGARQAGRSAVAFEAGGECCRVMPVIGGADVLGAITLFHRGALAEVAVRTFERSSSVIGIVLLSWERMEATRHRGASAMLRALVAPRQDDPAMLADRAGRLRFDLAQPLALLLVALEAPGAAYAARRLCGPAPLGEALVDDIDSTLVVLCGAMQAPDVRQAVAAWAGLEAGGRQRGVLSRPVATAAEIPALHATLGRMLGVLGRLGVQAHIVAKNELALYSALFETHHSTSLGQFLEAKIGPPPAHDQRRGTPLAATLLCHFDTRQNTKTTAQRLGIHVNAVRQRLATVEDLIGPIDPAARALDVHSRAAHVEPALRRRGTPAPRRATRLPGEDVAAGRARSRLPT